MARSYDTYRAVKRNANRSRKALSLKAYRLEFAMTRAQVDREMALWPAKRKLVYLTYST